MCRAISRFRETRSRFFQKVIFKERKALTVQETYTLTKRKTLTVRKTFTLTVKKTLTDKHSLTIVMPLIFGMIFSAMVALVFDILMMGFEKLYRLLETALPLV